MSLPIHKRDRRATERLPVEREVQYKVLNGNASVADAAGKTVNMSSSGVLFTTGQTLFPGRRVEVAINWPAQLDNKCALKLVARGRVVRFQNGCAAVAIMQHEFRTRKSQ
jgi:hypothetical protein